MFLCVPATWWTASAGSSPGPRTFSRWVPFLTGAAWAEPRRCSSSPSELKHRQGFRGGPPVGPESHRSMGGGSHTEGFLYRGTGSCKRPWRSPPCWCRWAGPASPAGAPSHCRSDTIKHSSDLRTSGTFNLRLKCFSSSGINKVFLNLNWKQVSSCLDPVLSGCLIRGYMVYRFDFINRVLD